jgi:hypothetical protein
MLNPEAQPGLLLAGSYSADSTSVADSGMTACSWTGHMEPPGKRDGPTLAFVEYRCDELHWDESLINRVGLDSALACTGYSALLRVGCCLTAVLKTGSPTLATKSVLTNPRHWTAIWPAFGTKAWPPLTQQTVVGFPPLRVGLRPPR